MHRNMPVDLVLVRHGQSEGNLAQKLARQGQLDLWTSEFRDRHNSLYRLTDMGRMQARIAGEYIRRNISPLFDKYFTSEYVRAMETAAALELPHARWATEVYLRERDRGVLANKPHSERMKDHHDEFVRKARDAFYWQPSGGESIANLCLRVDRVLENLGENCSGLRVIVVCHGGVIKSFRALIERVRSTEYRSHDKIHNCQIVWYTRRDPKTGYISSKYNWVRSICPWNLRLSQYTNEWREIKRHVYSNLELLRSVRQVQQLVNLALTESRNLWEDAAYDNSDNSDCDTPSGSLIAVSRGPPPARTAAAGGSADGGGAQGTDFTRLRRRETDSGVGGASGAAAAAAAAAFDDNETISTQVPSTNPPTPVVSVAPCRKDEDLAKSPAPGPPAAAAGGEQRRGTGPSSRSSRLLGPSWAHEDETSEGSFCDRNRVDYSSIRSGVSHPSQYGELPAAANPRRRDGGVDDDDYDEEEEEEEEEDVDEDGFVDTVGAEDTPKQPLRSIARHVTDGGGTKFRKQIDAATTAAAVATAANLAGAAPSAPASTTAGNTTAIPPPLSSTGPSAVASQAVASAASPRNPPPYQPLSGFGFGDEEDENASDDSSPPTSYVGRPPVAHSLDGRAFAETGRCYGQGPSPNQVRPDQLPPKQQQVSSQQPQQQQRQQSLQQQQPRKRKQNSDPRMTPVLPPEVEDPPVMLPPSAEPLADLFPSAQSTAKRRLSVDHGAAAGATPAAVMPSAALTQQQQHHHHHHHQQQQQQPPPASQPPVPPPVALRSAVLPSWAELMSQRDAAYAHYYMPHPGYPWLPPSADLYHRMPYIPPWDPRLAAVQHPAAAAAAYMAAPLVPPPQAHHHHQQQQPPPPVRTLEEELPPPNMEYFSSNASRPATAVLSVEALPQAHATQQPLNIPPLPVPYQAETAGSGAAAAATVVSDSMLTAPPPQQPPQQQPARVQTMHQYQLQQLQQLQMQQQSPPMPPGGSGAAAAPASHPASLLSTVPSYIAAQEAADVERLSPAGPQALDAAPAPFDDDWTPHPLQQHRPVFLPPAQPQQQQQAHVRPLQSPQSQQQQPLYQQQPQQPLQQPQQPQQQPQQPQQQPQHQAAAREQQQQQHPQQQVQQQVQQKVHQVPQSAQQPKASHQQQHVQKMTAQHQQQHKGLFQQPQQQQQQKSHPQKTSRPKQQQQLIQRQQSQAHKQQPPAAQSIAQPQQQQVLQEQQQVIATSASQQHQPPPQQHHQYHQQPASLQQQQQMYPSLSSNPASACGGGGYAATASRRSSLDVSSSPLGRLPSGPDAGGGVARQVTQPASAESGGCPTLLAATAGVDEISEETNSDCRLKRLSTAPSDPKEAAAEAVSSRPVSKNSSMDDVRVLPLTKQSLRVLQQARPPAAACESEEKPPDAGEIADDEGASDYEDEDDAADQT